MLVVHFKGVFKRTDSVTVLSAAVMLKIQNRNDLDRIVLHQRRFSLENTMDVYLQYDLTVVWGHLTKKRLSKARKSKDSLLEKSPLPLTTVANQLVEEKIH